MVIAVSNARASTFNVNHEDQVMKTMKGTINLEPMSGSLSLDVLLSFASRRRIAQCVSAIEEDTENLNSK